MKIVKFSEMFCLVNFEKKDWSQKFIRIIQNSRTEHQGKRVYSQAKNNKQEQMVGSVIQQAIKDISWQLMLLPLYSKHAHFLLKSFI